MVGRSEDITDQYERHAVRWDRERPRHLMEKDWLDAFLKLTGPSPSVLELGPGAGEPIAAYLVNKGAQLTGLDSSPSMIALCRQRFPDHDWRVGDMRTWVADRAFDGLIAWDSFFHLTSDAQRNMFPLFAQYIRRGGALMFTSGHEQGEAIGRLCGEPLYHASLDTSEYNQLLNDNGFQVAKHVIEDKTCGDHTVWLAKRL